MKFYEDPTYIEMCRGAGEIQEQCPDIDDAKSFWIDIENNTYNHNIWLPRLDQLIDMLDESVSKEYKTPYYKIWEFYEYAMVKTEPHGDWTTEQVMIQFVMYKKYRKEWDFDKKQWVKI